MERTTRLADADTSASDGKSAAFDEKPSRQPSVSSSDSVRSNHDREANQLQEKGEHVTEQDDNVTPLEPVQSRHPSVRDASSIPNGGLWAWLQVLGGFFLLFNSW